MFVCSFREGGLEWWLVKCSQIDELSFENNQSLGWELSSADLESTHGSALSSGCGVNVLEKFLWVTSRKSD